MLEVPHHPDPQDRAHLDLAADDAPDGDGIVIESRVRVCGRTLRVRWTDGEVRGDRRAVRRLQHLDHVDLGDPAGFLRAVRIAFGHDTRTTVRTSEG